MVVLEEVLDDDDLEVGDADAPQPPAYGGGGGGGGAPYQPAAQATRGKRWASGAAERAAKAKEKGGKEEPVRAFRVDMGTVVVEGDEEDDGVEAERELGNDAFRDGDFETAAVHYTAALEAAEESHKEVDAKRVTALRTNRAQAYIKLERFQEAREDCEAAEVADPLNVKALYRGAVACFRLGDLDAAVSKLERAVDAAPGNVEVGVLLRRCRAARSAQGVEDRALAAAAEARVRHGLAVRGADGRVESPSPLLAVEELVRLLIDADEEDEAVDVPATLAQLAEALGAGGEGAADARVYFGLCEGHLATLLYLEGDTLDAAAAVLRAAAGDAGAVSVPVECVARLTEIALREGSTEASVNAACALLEHAASDGVMRTSVFAADEGPEGLTPIAAITRALSDDGFLERIHATGAHCLAGLLARFGEDAASRAVLLEANAAPLAGLIKLYRAADDLPGAYIEDNRKRVEVPEGKDMVDWTNTQRRRFYNAPAVMVRRRVLEALAPLCRDSALLRAEAFERRTNRKRQVRTVSTGLIASLLDITRELRDQAPVRLAPTLGLDGHAKAYTMRPYAADYIRNPTGDMLVKTKDFEHKVDYFGREVVEDTEVDPDKVITGEEGSSEPCLVELALEVLLSAASNKNACKSMHMSGVLDVLGRMWDYVTVSVLKLTERLYAKLALASDAIVNELLDMSGVVPLCGLFVTGDRRLIHQANEKLQIIVPTCGGDEYMELTRQKGGLEVSYDLLCILQAEPALARDPLFAGGVGGAAVQRAAQQVFMQCLERSRMMQGKRGGRPPSGGCWDSFGPENVLRMEEAITGVKRRNANPKARTEQAKAVKAAKLAAATAAAAAAAAASATAKAPAPDKMAASAPAAPVPVPAPAPAAKPAAPLKPLPWDPVPSRAAGVPTTPDAAEEREPVARSEIKTGFLAGGGRRGRRERERLEAERMRRATERALAEEAKARAEEAAAAEAAAAAAYAAPDPDEFDEAFEEEYLEAQRRKEAEAKEAREAAARKAKALRDKTPDFFKTPEQKAAVRAEKAGEYDEDGVRVKYDSAPTGVQRDFRKEWLNTDIRDKIRWTQSAKEVSAWIKVPKGTRAAEMQVEVTPTHLSVRLNWYGRVVDGPLFRRCKASESVWSVQDDEVQVMLPKDDPYFWKALFEGGEEKSHMAVMHEMMDADDDPTPYDELDEKEKSFQDEMREHRALLAQGLINEEDDDFRCVIGDGDGAK